LSHAPSPFLLYFSGRVLNFFPKLVLDCIPPT
jgi:hypothetical protein